MSAPSDSFAEKLRVWRISRNFTQAEAAQHLAIDRSYLSQVERGRPPGAALRTRFLLVERSTSFKIDLGTVRTLRHLPVISWAEAGQVRAGQETPPGAETVPSDVADERAFGVRLRGDSMEPKFSDGDIAILLPGAAPTSGEIVVANLKEHGPACKIMHVRPERKLVTLSSYHPAYPPIEYHLGDFHWIYPVAAVVKQLRRR